MSHKIVKEWTTKAGLKAVILLVNNGSHHCGYVQAPENLKGTHYIDVEDHIDVHGGVTYSGEDYWDTKLGWYFGYDCAHYNDKVNCPDDLKHIPSLAESPAYTHGVWRDEAYCTEECESLANQLNNFDVLTLLN